MNKLDSLQTQVDSLRTSNEALQDSVQNLYAVKPFSTAWYNEFMKSSRLRRVFPNSNILMKGGVNPYVHPQLFLALSDYDGPPISVTSMYRPSSLGSLHACGKAIDISWNENAEIFISWVENTQQGKQWLEKYSLEIHCENLQSKDRETYKKYYRYIKWATGPHIHLELKN